MLIHVEEEEVSFEVQLSKADSKRKMVERWKNSLSRSKVNRSDFFFRLERNSEFLLL